jgi:hypothetical protein
MVVRCIIATGDWQRKIRFERVTDLVLGTNELTRLPRDVNAGREKLHKIDSAGAGAGAFVGLHLTREEEKRKCLSSAATGDVGFIVVHT